MTIDFSNIIKDKTAYVRVREYNRIIKECLKRLKSESHKEDKILRDMMLIKTLMHTGRRVSEIVGKKPYTLITGVRPIDLNEGYTIDFCILKKNHVKSKNKAGQMRPEEMVTRERLTKEPKRVLMPVDKGYYRALESYIKYLGLHSDSHKRIFPITRRRVNYILEDYAATCKIVRGQGKRLSAHMFRHGYAIQFLKANRNDSTALQNLKMQLGHSSINITCAYLQFIPEDRRKLIENMFKGGLE